MSKVSRRFVAAVKLSLMWGYRIAHQAGIHPSGLSRIRKLLFDRSDLDRLIDSWKE